MLIAFQMSLMPFEISFKRTQAPLEKAELQASQEKYVLSKPDTLVEPKWIGKSKLKILIPIIPPRSLHLALELLLIQDLVLNHTLQPKRKLFENGRPMRQTRNLPLDLWVGVGFC